MSIKSIIKSLLNVNKEINLKELPSQGYFYKSDFKIKIKKVDIADIKEYENNYSNNNFEQILEKLKLIVKKNTILSKKYTFDDIKNIDIIYIFLEIVKITNNKSIKIKVFNSLNKEELIDFGPKTFNYFKISNNLMLNYDNKTKEFVFDGYRYSIPSIGVENSIVSYLMNISDEDGINTYKNYSYDFIYFLGNKKSISHDEIENLIILFNDDLDNYSKNYISDIVKKMSPIGIYSIKNNSEIIDISDKIDIGNIFK